MPLLDIRLTLGGSGTSGAVTAVPTPPAIGVTAVGTPIGAWKIQVDERIYVNAAPEMGPTAWVPFTARYIFSDGNAVLTRDPDCVLYTGGLTVGVNLRRLSETYNSSYPGP